MQTFLGVLLPRTTSVLSPLSFSSSDRRESERAHCVTLYAFLLTHFPPEIKGCEINKVHKVLLQPALRQTPTLILRSEKHGSSRDVNKFEKKCDKLNSRVKYDN